MITRILAWLLLAAAVTGSGASSSAVDAADSADFSLVAQTEGLLARDNLMPFEVPWNQGGKERGPDVQAKIVKEGGFRRYAIVNYSYNEPMYDVDATLKAMRQHGVIVSAVLLESSNMPHEDPVVTKLFDSFKRHHVSPQIWVTQSYSFFPKTGEEWRQRLSESGFSWPIGADLWTVLQLAFSSKSDFTLEQKERFFKAWHHIFTDAEHLPRTPEEQQRRVEEEARRIKPLAQLASRYGFRVALYNHGGWFGVMDNQAAIIERLHKDGISNVGIAYSFWHARDELHDDVKQFDRTWKRIQPYVAAIGVSGVSGELESLYPSQGNDELGMLRIIQESGWRGPVFILCFNFGVDPATGLRNVLKGIDWLSAELQQSGSGGPRPFGLEAISDY